MQIKDFPSGTPLTSDLIVFQSLTDETYRKASISQLPFSSPNNNSGGENWQLINANYTATANSKIFSFATSDITLTLPIATPGQHIEIFNFTSTSKMFINLQGKKYQAALYDPTALVFQGNEKTVKLVYFDELNGWYPILNVLESFSNIPTYIYLPLTETSGSTAVDASGNNRNGVYVDASLNASGAVLNGSSRISLSNQHAALSVLSIGLEFRTNNTSNQGLWEFRASQDLSSGTFTPALMMNSGGNLSIYGFPSGTSYTSQIYNDNLWHKSIVIISGGIVKIFVDKVKIADVSANPVTAFNGFFSIGATRANGSFIGQLKNFRVWNTALSNAEAIELS